VNRPYLIVLLTGQSSEQERAEDNEENVRHPLDVIPTEVEESLNISGQLTRGTQK